MYTKPSAKALLEVLEDIKLAPLSWDIDEQRVREPWEGHPGALATYLTQIISSGLYWIDDDDQRELIYELASKRLAERSGRSAISSMSRVFRIASPDGMLEINIREPTLTADNLGFKTWASSYMLAKHLASIPAPIKPMKTLELGAGTGLVGIAAASIWGSSVHLTDLAEIVPNLRQNINNNAAIVKANGGSATAGLLNWSETRTQLNEDDLPLFVLVADCIYAPEHPRLLVETIAHWLRRHSDSRVAAEFPLRVAYDSDLRTFRDLMHVAGLEIREETEEIGYDDWDDTSGQPKEVRCWYSLWSWKAKDLTCL